MIDAINALCCAGVHGNCYLTPYAVLRHRRRK